MQLLSRFLTKMLAYAIIRAKREERAVHNISVRRLQDGVYQRLRQQAKRHGVSMEEEARQILTNALAAPENLSDLFRDHFGEDNGVDLHLIGRDEAHQPIDFGL